MMLNPIQRDLKMSNNYIYIKVPLSDGSRTYIYFKKHKPNPERGQSNANKNQSLYNVFNQDNKKKSLINVVTFEKPSEILYQKAIEEEQLIKNRELKSDEDLPPNRTIFAINFEKDLSIVEIKRYFGLIGKIRKVYTGKLKKKKSISDKTPIKNIYFAIIIFKFEKQMFKCFDQMYFQAKIDQSFQQITNKLTAEKREEYAFNLVKKYGGEDQEKEAKFDEFKSIMEDGGFTLVMDHKEDMDVDQMLEKAKKNAEAPKRQISVKKKKKKSLEKDDFYKFQVNNKKFQQALDPEDFDESNLNEKELIEYKRKKLKIGFDEDVKRLNMIRQKQNKSKLKEEKGEQEE